MKTELVMGDSIFELLSSEWDELASHGMTDTPFQTLAYQRAWWTHLRPDGATLLSVVTRDEEGALQGIGCFYAHNGQLHFNGCIEETDYLDIITPTGQAKEVWRATWECLMAEDIPTWRILELCNVPANSLTRTILPELARAYGSDIDESVNEVCPVIQLPATFEDYLSILDSKQRRELSRKLRRAEAADVITTVIEADAKLDEEVDDFLNLLQKSTFEKRDWLNRGRRALFHEVARAAQDAGTLQLMFTSIEGRRAAGLFNFDYKDRIWVYNSGLDPAAFAALSPGLVLTATTIRHAIESGRKEFDFLRGNEEYKYRFGAVDTRIYRLRVVRPG